MSYYPKGKRITYPDGSVEEYVTGAVIYKDPILKKYPTWHKVILNHELREIKARSKGASLNEAHKIARSKEGKRIKNLSLRQMWDKLK